MRGSRFLRRAAASTIGAMLAVACFASTRGGSDSETHFVCSADQACQSLGSNFKCIRGLCQSVTPAPSPREGGTSTFPSTPEAGPIPTGSDSGPVVPGPWGMPLQGGTTLHGTISIPDGMKVSPADLRVALVWEVFNIYGVDDPACQPVARAAGTPYESGSNVFSSASVADIRVDENGHFTLDVTATPPYDAFPHPSSRQGGSNVANGAIFVYEDGDHDGRLEFSTFSQASPDVILGTSNMLGLDTELSTHVGPEGDAGSFRISYSDIGDFSDKPPLMPGFTIVHFYGKTGPEALPTDTDIPIVLSERLGVRALICEKLCWAVGTGFTCPDRAGDVPGGGERNCQPWTPGFTKWFEWNASTCDGCKCAGHVCTYSINPTDPVPADWPCAQATDSAGP